MQYKNINKKVSKCDILHLILTQKADSVMCMKMIMDKVPALLGCGESKNA